MKALVYLGAKKVEVQEKEVKPLKEGQARIRVTYCGICGSDIGIYGGTHPRAKAPLILGHEFVGIVEEIKGGTGKIKVGDRVAPYPLISCGSCFACKTGIPHVCQTLKLIGIDVDGGIAEYVNCDEDVLFTLKDSLCDEAAAVIEPLAVIIRTLHQADFRCRDSAVIIGAGPIGILTGIVLKHSGASRIIISDIDEKRLNICREFGFEALNSGKENLIAYVNEKTGGTGMDKVFECSGAEPAALDMTKLCRIGGVICLTGVHKAPHAVNLQDVNFKEQILVGSRVYTKLEFEQAVELASVMEKELKKIVTHIVPIEKSDSVFDLIKNANETTVKVLVDCR